MSAAAKKLAESLPSLLPIPTPVPNRRVLVVDDEPQICESLKLILTPNSNQAPQKRSSRSKEAAPAIIGNNPTFEVVTVNNPDDAILAVEESLRLNRPFAMGFFDVLLGAKIDGIELVKKVQALDPHIYSIFVTAYHDRSVDSISQFLGEDNLDRWDYINKPFTEGEILQKARHITSLWDLHRLKEWQDERLSEAQKLLLQNERHTTVAAVGRSFAHEFGNLLTHIVGNAEMAVLKNDPERVKEALKVILKASETASSLLGKFKKLHQGADSKSNRFQLVNLQLPLEESLELMSFQFRKSKIEWIKETFDAVLVEADKHSLVQVLMNIFINSTHALNEGGKIFINLKKLDANTALISIRDTGSGIPEEILDKVTEPLFTTKGSKGTGLGLAITKEIIEIEHQGQLSIKNHPDGGLLIELKLPLRQEVL